MTQRYPKISKTLETRVGAATLRRTYCYGGRCSKSTDLLDDYPRFEWRSMSRGVECMIVVPANEVLARNSVATQKDGGLKAHEAKLLWLHQKLPDPKTSMATKVEGSITRSSAIDSAAVPGCGASAVAVRLRREVREFVVYGALKILSFWGGAARIEITADQVFGSTEPA